MTYNIHPIEPLHAFGPCEVNESVLIARLDFKDDGPTLEVLSSSYTDVLNTVLNEQDGSESLNSWTKSLEMLSLALVEAQI